MALGTVVANSGSGGATFRTVSEAGGQVVAECAMAYVDATPEPVRVSASTPIPSKVTDGTNAVAVKAASTAAAATDPALVVAVSPNNAVSVTQTTPTAQIWKSFNATTTQTGAAVWTPAGGKKVAITSVQIGAYGTTSARLILWFGAGGGSPDTTYTEGTDQPVVKQSFAPGANGYPGLVQSFSPPLICANADYVLRVTTDAALSHDIVVYGYET